MKKVIKVQGHEAGSHRTIKWTPSHNSLHRRKKSDKSHLKLPRRQETTCDTEATEEPKSHLNRPPELSE